MKHPASPPELPFPALPSQTFEPNDDPHKDQEQEASIIAMYSPFAISENNHIWKQEMSRRERTLARRLKINPVDDITMRDLEGRTLRHRLVTVIAGLARRPSTTRSVPGVRTVTNT